MNPIFKIFLPLAMASISLQAVDSTIISDYKTFDKSVHPGKMQTAININANAKTFAKAKELLEEFKATVAQQNICDTSGAFITPKYTYANNQPTQDGYSAKINTSCEFIDIKDYDAVLNLIYNKAKSFNAQISTSPIVWIVSDDTLESTQTELKAEAIKYARTQSKQLGTQLDMKCNVHSIKFNTQQIAPFALARANTPDMLAPTIAPDAKEQSIKLNAEYVWSCASN